MFNEMSLMFNELLQVFTEMNLEMKKKFLIFVTGSDRIPIHGIHSIKLVIALVQDNGRYVITCHMTYNNNAL